MKQLTAMQAACWMGRSGHSDLGGVASHLYAEFDGPALDPDRLSAALARIGQAHPMLRLQVSADGIPSFAADGALKLELDDFSSLGPEEREEKLQSKRRQWSHQQLDLAAGQAARFSLSLLGGGAGRLHVDADMIAVDPSSFRLLIEDLALMYASPDAPLPPPPSFFDWHERIRVDETLRAAREQDRDWWRARLADIAPAPALPRLASPPAQAHSHRLCARLSPQERQSLRQLARHQDLTLSGLMLGLFAQTLADATGDQRFRLNLPLFWREPVLPGAERAIGEFANLTLIDVDIAAAPTTAALCRQLTEQMLERVGRSAYPGINLMRDLSRHHGSPQLAPVVFTAAVDLPGGDLFSERVRSVFGAMDWVISQGSQVALDAQVASADGGILINWDIRLDALPQDWVQRLFECFVERAREAARRPASLDQPLSPPARPQTESKPLTALQQAYLLGRSAQLPLGGVAMQEFREYRGRLSPYVLKARLGEMAARHESLRTVIDPDKLVQRVLAQPVVHLREIDLRALPLEAALQQTQAGRDDYAHALFDLASPPWEVTLFLLPDDELIAFARFDALILDGRSIAALMREVFEGVKEDPAPSAAAARPSAADAASARQADALYWQTKLANASGAPRLPWLKPLEQLGTARFERQSLAVSADRFNALCKLGAKQRFFKNTVVMALILEVLSHWLDEGGLCVAVPVAPSSSGAFANRSSFIAIDWRLELDSLAERGASLQTDVMRGLQHLAFSGVDLARQLFERHGPAPALPVVLTNGLGWPIPSADSPMRWQSGLTQTPQVAMDIRFSLNPDGGLAIDIDYAREALAPAMVGDILSAVDRAIEQIAASNRFAVDASSLLDYGHYRHNSAETAACGEDFLGRIAAQIFDPDNARAALIAGERRIAYRELGDGVSRAIAALQIRGATAGKTVAICLPRGPEHTIATLACAFSGAVWVPIDAAAPAERLRYLLDNCRPDLVIASQPLDLNYAQATPGELLAAPARLPPRDGWRGLSLSDAPAYCLYTSGTTGRPKCVVVNNRATANVVGATLARWQACPDDVFLSVTPLHHDMSVFDVFGSLAAGAALVLPEPGEEKDAARWNQLIDQHGVTLWCSVPAMLEMLLACRSNNGLRSLRLIAQGGDYIKPSVIADLRASLPEARLISLGGPTETTIWSIWHDIADADRAQVPYGRPLPGNRYWLLNERGEHCPAGVAGRIHTSGVNLALGYREDAQLTQQDFIAVADPSGQAVRAFRTGDRGRYRPDGTLMFDSRVNGYIKVRGVRVSLPDIEMELIRHPALAQVLAVDFGEEAQGELAIGALYVCKATEAVSVAALRGHVQSRLPVSHAPTRYLQVEQLPLSRNGKPDRAAARALLQAAGAKRAAPAGIGPVLDIYLDVLGRARQELADETADFSSLGLLPQHLKTISARLRDALAIELSPGQLLRCRNAADVERLLAAAQS